MMLCASIFPYFGFIITISIVFGFGLAEAELVANELGPLVDSHGIVEIEVDKADDDNNVLKSDLSQAYCSRGRDKSRVSGANVESNCPDSSNGEIEDHEKLKVSKSRSKRQTQSEKLFVGAQEKTDFSDLDFVTESIKWYNTRRPEGFSLNDKTVLLLFNPNAQDYPPFSYRGFDAPKLWHRIDIKTLMKKRNRSFMLLENTCDVRHLKGRVSTDSALDLAAIRKCEAEEYGKLYPICDSDLQSPINIVTKRVKASTLPNYMFSNARSTDSIPIIMSLPWDGTSLLTVELTNAVRDPEESLEKIIAEVGQGAVVERGNASFFQIPSISLGSLKGPNLFLDRIQIHYGTHINEGSEHQIDGKSFAMELQFIFTQFGRSNSRKYWQRLQTDYLQRESGVNADLGKLVHILAVLVEVVPDSALPAINAKDNWNRKASDAFEPISLVAKEFWSVSNRLVDGKKFRAFKTNPSVTLQSEKNLLKLQDILPPKELKDKKEIHSTYFAYTGGLTHPPCFDNIDWAIYSKTLKINMTAWKRFLYIPSEFDDSGFVAGNFRPISSVYIKSADLSITVNTQEKVSAALKRQEEREVRQSRPDTTTSDEDYLEDYSFAVFRVKVFIPIVFTFFIYETVKFFLFMIF